MADPVQIPLEVALDEAYRLLGKSIVSERLLAIELSKRPPAEQAN